MDESNPKAMSIRLSEAHAEWLRECAFTERTTQAALIREAIDLLIARRSHD